MPSKFIQYRNAIYVRADSGAVELQTEQFEQHKSVQLERTFSTLVDLLPADVRSRPEIARAVRSVLTQIEGIKAMVAGNPDPEDSGDTALEHYIEDSGPEAEMGGSPDDGAGIAYDVDEVSDTDVPPVDD